jgi:hypothetical protein
MKKVFLAVFAITVLFAAFDVRAEEIAVVCGLREELNFNSIVQVIYLKVDMENKSINGIPSRVYDKDIITYETEAESLTFIMPSMLLRVIRKGSGAEGVDIKYSGDCSRDKLIFE